MTLIHGDPIERPRDLALYVHVPFCPHKCHYCDFNSYAGLDDLMPEYTRAIIAEVDAEGARVQTLLDSSRLGLRTINFGGGTPSTMPPPSLAAILDAIGRAFKVPSGIEVSLEANPGTVDLARLRELRAIGFNRISYGVQTFDEHLLTDLGRIHSAAEAATSLHNARRAGFANVNLDLMYGLPTQDLATWRDTLERAISLETDHLSLYSLQIEPGTVYFQRWQAGALPVPDDDLVADMYDFALDRLATAGFRQYEISNWARSDEHRCQHNLVYWANEPYLGLGPGAHSWIDARRFWRVLSPREFNRRALGGQATIVDSEEIDPKTEMGETVMLGLRLNDGLGLARFRKRFGTSVERAFPGALRSSLDDGLAEIVDGFLRLTDRGRPVGNEVFSRFIGEIRSTDAPPDDLSGSPVKPRSQAKAKST